MYTLNISNKVLKHGIIIGLLLAYLVSADYIFDKLITFSNESIIVNKAIPKSSDEIKYSIDTMETARIKWKDSIYVSGWAFIDGQNADGQAKYLVFSSDKNTYVFNTFTRVRIDVTYAMGNNSGLDLNQSGYFANIPIKSISPGIYKVGLLVEGKEKIYYKEDGIYVTIQENKFTNGFISSQKDVNIPNETNNIAFSVDTIVHDKNGEHGDRLMISGWAFINDKKNINPSKYIILKSEGKTHIYDSINTKRIDVKEYFKKDSSYMLEDSGFLVHIPTNIPDGKYQVGILVECQGSKGSVFSDRFIEKVGNNFIIEYASELSNIDIMSVNAKAIMNIERITEKDDMLMIKGWGFIEEKNSEGNEIFVVLKSSNKIYTFTTEKIKRKDVTEYFKDLKLDLEDSGFNANIPKSFIENGEYNIGVYIVNDSNKAIKLSSKTYIK